jgi:cell division protein FtsI (penicillin-binding protein 3)
MMRFKHYQQIPKRPKEHVVYRASTGTRAVEQGKNRIICIVSIFALSYAALAIRVMEVSLMRDAIIPFRQLVTQPHLLLKSDSETNKMLQAQHDRLSPRKQIRDRNGVVIADNIVTASLVANPQLVRHKDVVSKQLKKVLPELSRESIENSLSRDSKFSYIKRHLTPKQQADINALGIAGLFFETDIKRIYPHRELFAHPLGYVGVDSQGLAGIEQYFDKQLSDPYAPNEPLNVSLDVSLQMVVHEELNASMKNFRAKGGAVVLVDAQTNEVLAMSSLPTFDPNHPSDASDEGMFNRASLGTYEMGSTFKTFTLAMGLANDVITPTHAYDISDPIRVGGYTIRDYHPMKGYHSVAEIFAESSNIGTVKIAMDVGKKRQKKYLKSLGLFDPVSIELPERATPLVPKKWRDVNAMTISYGHGISVTPLHMAQALSALIKGENGRGLTIKKKEKTEYENIKNAAQEDTIKAQQLLTEKQSKDVANMLRLVVSHGTASKANVKGYRVGGKTGTAEKFKNGKYQKDDMVTSFISVFPSDQPRYVLVTMLDEPRPTKETYGFATAGWTAVPLAGRIIERVAPYLGVQPVIEIESKDKEPFRIVKRIKKRPSSPEQATLQHASLGRMNAISQ